MIPETLDVFEFLDLQLDDLFINVQEDGAYITNEEGDLEIKI